LMKTNMRSTSLEAYFNEVKPDLGPRQKEIVKIFRDNPGMTFTNNELLEERRLIDPLAEINQVTPRVYELRGEGKKNPFKEHPMLIESCKRKCRITHRTVIAWQFNNK